MLLPANLVDVMSHSLHINIIGTLSKLTGRPRGGGLFYISIQLRAINVKGQLNSLGLESFWMEFAC